MPAQFVALPLYDGELGVAPGHSPFIGRLGYGELRVRENGKTVRYYVDGGFVQVADNVVSVLTNSAIPAEKLDAEPRPNIWPPRGLAKPTRRSCWPSAKRRSNRLEPNCEWPSIWVWPVENERAVHRLVAPHYSS